MLKRRPLDSLTPRELEVLELIRLGLTNEEIAERLGITLRGAKYHVSEILSKLGVSTREEASVWRSPEDRPLWQRLILIPMAAKVTALVIVVAAATGIGVLAWGTVATGGPSAGSGASGDLRGQAVSCEAFQYCGSGLYCDQDPSPVAIVGRLAPGHSASELEGAGYKAVQALAVADPGHNFFGTRLEPDLVAISRSSGYINSDDIPSDLRTNPALSSVGWLRHATLDLSLRSCDYKLEDNPRASELARRATQTMVANGVLTEEQLAAGGTTFQLSEDPTNPQHLFFTVLLIKSAGEGTGPKLSDLFKTYAATIDKATGEVLNAGRAQW